MLAVIGLVSTSFGVALASALFPLISIELFLLGVVLHDPVVPWWMLALITAVGQTGGKLLHYYAAKGLIQLPQFLGGKGGACRFGGRWQCWFDRFRRTCDQRPMWTMGLLFCSATTSLPPYVATCVVAGWAQVPVSTFLVTGLLGRFARFSVLAMSPGIVAAWV